jgi:transposase
LAGIEAVAMDMGDPFIESTVDHVPDGRSKIVFDRYHVMLHRNHAVDQVRKSEQRRLHARGDDSLKRTKYLWLFAAENISESRTEAFAALRARPLKRGRA